MGETEHGDFSLYSKDCWTQQRKIHHIGVCLSQWRCDENEETGRISYYTSKKEVVYTSLLMCENAPQEWQNVPAENIRRFQKSVRYKRADNQNAALEKFKLTFQKQRLWNEVLRIEKVQMHNSAGHLSSHFRKNGADRNRLIIQLNIFKRPL